MQTTLLILPIVLSVLFWAAYHYHKDRHLPEPLPNLALCFALGIGAAMMSRYLYMSLDYVNLRFDAVALAAQDPLGLLVYAVLVIGPLEEFAKLLPFLLVVMRMKTFDEPLDGIIYASFIALGFAAAENVYYLDSLTPLQSAARGFASPVIHILFASIWAHWITRSWLAKRPIRWSLLAGFGISATLHGIYDFLILLQPVAALPIAAILIAAIWVWRLLLMRRMHTAAVNASKEAANDRSACEEQS